MFSAIGLLISYTPNPGADIQIKVVGFNVDPWHLSISYNGLGVAEVAEDDFDEVGNPLLGDRFAW